MTIFVPARSAALYAAPTGLVQTGILTRGVTAPGGGAVAGACGFAPSAIGVGWLPFGYSPREYRVLRGNGQIAGISTAQMAFMETGLPSGFSTSYTIMAVNADGTYSLSDPVTATSLGSSGLIWKSTFEDCPTDVGALIPGYVRDTGGVITGSTARARTGSRSLKFDFPFSTWSPTDNHCMVQQSVYGRATGWLSQATLGADMWVGVSTFIDYWPPDDPSNGELIWQFHGSTGGPAQSSSPPLALYIHGSDVAVEIQGDGSATSYPTETLNGPHARVVSPTWDIADLTGVWVDWVICVNFNYSGARTRVWKDGVLVVDDSGANIYRWTGNGDSPGPYFDFGIYKWDWGVVPTLVDRRIAYFDEVRIGDATASYSVVAPGQ